MHFIPHVGSMFISTKDLMVTALPLPDIEFNTYNGQVVLTKKTSHPVCPSGLLMYVSVCLFVRLLVCVVIRQSSVRPSVHPAVRPVWLSVSLKCFADPQTLMLTTLLNSPGIRKHFNSPLRFKPSALGIITNFELKALIVYQNVPADRSFTCPSARPPYHPSALRSPAGSPCARSPNR